MFCFQFSSRMSGLFFLPMWLQPAEAPYLRFATLFQLVKFHPNALGDVPDRNGGEEANAFSSRGRGCTGLVEVLMIFLALFLSGAAMKPSSCSCARAFRMVPLPAASALLSSRSPGMAFVNCPDRRRCFNLATVLDWAVSPGCVFMGESYFLVTSDGKRSCRLCFSVPRFREHGGI